MDAVKLFTFSTLVLDIYTSQKTNNKNTSHCCNAWRLKAGLWTDPSEIKSYLNIIHELLDVTGRHNKFITTVYEMVEIQIQSLDVYSMVKLSAV